MSGEVYPPSMGLDVPVDPLDAVRKDAVVRDVLLRFVGLHSMFHDECELYEEAMALLERMDTQEEEA